MAGGFAAASAARGGNALPGGQGTPNFSNRTSPALEPVTGAPARTTTPSPGVATTRPPVDPVHVAELTAANTKFTPSALVATGRTPNGQVVFMETGNSRAGLQHIVERHAGDFAKIGVSESQIPSVVMRAVTEGRIVGYQGTGQGRGVYEIQLNDSNQRIAVTVGNNGFIVGANPAGRAP